MRLSAVAYVPVLLLFACSAGTSGFGHRQGAADTGGESGGNGNGGDGNLIVNGGGTGNLLIDNGGATGSGATGSGATSGNGCGVVQKPEEIDVYAPIALFIMLDRSGSMVTGFPEGSAESWKNSTNAFTSFVNDPSSQGIDVGLGFFPTAPDNGFTCGDGTGSGSDCGAPAVEIGPVAQTGPQLIAAMNGATPNPINLTPTECGLIGMISHCEAWTKKTGEQCVAILATDGNPTLCSGDTSALAKIVSDGKAQGVSTFVLGLPGSNASVLDPLAQAGGSNKSIDVSGGSPAIIAALNTIRSKVSVATALPCKWTIPAPPSGQVFNPERVNVRFTPQGGAGTNFGYVSESDCSKASNAWHFDDPNKATEVELCPSTCDTLATGAEIDVEFGCARVQAPIM